MGTDQKIKEAKVCLRLWINSCLFHGGRLKNSTLWPENYWALFGALSTGDGERALELFINNQKSQGEYTDAEEFALNVVGVLKLYPANKEISDYLECVCEESMMGFM